jgi:hypothetical protein
MKLGLALIVVSIGCNAAQEQELEQPLKDDGSNCPAWMCGQNSPLVDNFTFHDFSLLHIENADLIRYEKFTLNDTEYQLHVTNGVVGATTASSTITGAGLIGGNLWVQYDGGPEYVIHIANVSSTTFWAKPLTGNPISLPTYTLQWGATQNGIVTGDFHDLCANPPKEDDSLGLDTHQSVIFEGDIVDAATKTITGYDGNTVNIGCAGSTLAKMHLTGHTRAAAAYGFVTTVDERQTMLKMLSADYCGDGTPFTVAGMPLQWADDHGWMHVSDQTSATIEARWNAKGATCLMKPRVQVNPTELAKTTFGDPGKLVELISAHCKLPPPCDDQSLSPKPDHLVSANPSL